MDVEHHTKAGHLPATKAGGMRISRKARRHSESNTRTSSESSEIDIAPSEHVITKHEMNQQAAVDFPTAAVEKCHNKPLPTHQIHTRFVKTHHVVQQPRKD